MNKRPGEARIEEIMAGTGVTRAEAEFIYAQENGQVGSDVLILIDPPVGPYSAAGEIEVWLEKLRGCPQTRGVRAAIRQAEEWLEGANQ